MENDPLVDELRRLHDRIADLEMVAMGLIKELGPDRAAYLVQFVRQTEKNAGIPREHGPFMAHLLKSFPE